MDHERHDQDYTTTLLVLTPRQGMNKMLTTTGYLAAEIERALCACGKVLRASLKIPFEEENFLADFIMEQVWQGISCGRPIRGRQMEAVHFVMRAKAAAKFLSALEATNIKETTRQISH